MTQTSVSIALFIILALLLVVINKRSISRHNATVNDINANKAAILDAKEQAFAHSDKLFSDATEHADSLYGETSANFEKRIEQLGLILSSLNDENKRLDKELNDLKKKLDFYLNIDSAAEQLSVNEDVQSRREAIEDAIGQIRTPNKGSSPSENKEKKRLDEEQEFARNYMETTNENLFVTGKAGTGKSFLLDVFRGTTKKNYIVLAPTGISAINIDGVTLHSAFGYYNLVNLNIDEISEYTLRLKNEKQMALRAVKTIIIDEISMVRADIFEKIDRILKVVNNSNLPFGGKQILVFGDLFQLPPVARGQEFDYLNDRYGGIYFFHSDAYKTGNFKFIELTQNHRQKEDQQYFEILNRIREGRATNEDIDLLNTRNTQDEDIYDRFVSLFPTKAEAEQVNRTRMNQLQTEEFLYKAKVLLDLTPGKNKNLESVFPIMGELKLKTGASVMMVANDPDHRWVNGTLGIVKELSPSKIVISFGNKKVYEVQPLEFDEQEITYSDGKITYEKVLSVLQYPIVPAYAITIHKSQGQTYANIVCDIEKCFAAGQAYVALSRCASLNGLHLKSKVSLASIKVNREVLEFYKMQLERKLTPQKVVNEWLQQDELGFEPIESLPLTPELLAAVEKFDIEKLNFGN